MPTRNEVFAALFDLTAGISWGSPAKSFITRSRRVKLFSDVSAAQQPALFQAEHLEGHVQKTNMPYKRTWEAQWIIYHNSGDPKAIPTETNNDILDAVEAALAPAITDPGYHSERNTLGGLVHHCFIDGTGFKDPGDIDNQAMIVVPIKILVP